jgi:hypothetical protein
MTEYEKKVAIVPRFILSNLICTPTTNTIPDALVLMFKEARKRLHRLMVTSEINYRILISNVLPAEPAIIFL